MPRALLAGLGAMLVIGVALIVVLILGGQTPAASTTTARAAAQAAYAPPPLATYDERSPHVASALNVYATQGAVRGAASAPSSTLPPVSPGAFAAPVAAYLAYSGRVLGVMEGQISSLKTALASGDRAQSQRTWLAAYASYLRLGGVYLEGQLATLNQAIDGTPGGLAGGVTSPRFSGLHRIEYGLWTGQPPTALEPWATRLGADVRRLRAMMPKVQISPLDYATRAHEILEDAVRDLLSGTDVPWSGAGVVGTNAGLVATTEIVNTLAPVLNVREGVLATVRSDLSGLRTTLESIARAHGGQLPTDAGLSQMQSEELDASTGQALEGLAQVPGALETTAAATPQIPQSAVKLDP